MQNWTTRHFYWPTRGPKSHRFFLGYWHHLITSLWASILAYSVSPKYDIQTEPSLKSTPCSASHFTQIKAHLLQWPTKPCLYGLDFACYPSDLLLLSFHTSRLASAPLASLLFRKYVWHAPAFRPCSLCFWHSSPSRYMLIVSPAPGFGSNGTLV